MHLFLGFLLLAAAGAVHAQDAAPSLPCPRPIRFSADYFPDPPTDFTKSAKDLVSLGAPAPKGSTALGLVTVGNAVSVKPAESCRGLVVQLKFENPTLRVARELPEDSCGHAHVLHHEWTHVRIYREMARQFRALEYPWPDDARPDAVLRWTTQQLNKLQEAQRLFDSPQEYATNAVACRGEIPKLLAAASGK